MLREACGIFGTYGHPSASELTFLGLYALQHRGDEGTGIVSSDGRQIYQHKGLGQVADVFRDRSTLDSLKGHLAIGHNRYSTTGASVLTNTQPFLVNTKDGPIAIAHNGNLVNTGSLRQELQGMGAIFQTTMDSEIIVHLVARSREEEVLDQIVDALSRVRGAYSALLLTRDKIIAARDPMGFRPLCLGRLDEAWIVASESCALDIVAAKYIRDVEPGEIVVIDKDGLRSLKPFENTRHGFCVFEYIYFSRPDSRIFGDYVDKTRRKLGRQLAIEQPTPGADIVISVPDSSNTAALGYSETSKIRFEIGLIRNHYVGRTFISPSQIMRELKVRIKYNPVGGVLKGKRVVIVEDSIVRGTTMTKLATMIRQAGAREVHVRVSSPPIRFPCYYGIDFQGTDELIASGRTVEEIRQLLRVDTLGYLSIEGMLRALPNSGHQYCVACFDENYPVSIEEKVEKMLLEEV